MAAPQILGMSIFAFIVAIFTGISSVFTLINTLRRLVPTARYRAARKEFYEVRKSWVEFDKEDSKLSPTRRKQYIAILHSLHQDVRALDFIGEPSCNIITVFRSIFKSWKVSSLAADVKMFRVAILTLSTQRRHIRYEQKKMDEGGAFVNLAPLEKRFHKLGGLYAEAFKKERRIDPARADVEVTGTPNAARATGTVGRNNIRRRINIDSVLPPPEQSASVAGHRSNTEVLCR